MIFWVALIPRCLGELSTVVFGLFLQVQVTFTILTISREAFGAAVLLVLGMSNKLGSFLVSLPRGKN
ncbi:hypothetical protein B0T26DRAFT_696009 [Lasiosphaeria miniovina]|uniref:Uncharacterized protein n=1 Tax=Lasiosphaeria miniovina TaxID=1954250 RepID=A0AA40B5T5_9PEZI|nr:uncharacterized protein B0T26DRAFT_696009 [Lasiosphaeria miniovina]KAK0727898.1 hypothetical protein B0T26DRAFT_696009 [Lasiosphaeria miniovina]